MIRGPGTPEEPHAWESREYLRNLTIGKVVTFKVEYKAGQRNFGTVHMDGENLCVAVAREGWAKVKSGENAREGDAGGDFEEMKRLGADAEVTRRGMFGVPSKPRNVQWSNVDTAGLLAHHKGQPLRVVVEHVRDGSSLRCLVLQDMAMINFQLAGIACPRVNVKAAAAPAAAAQQQPAAAANGDAAAENGSSSSSSSAKAAPTGALAAALSAPVEQGEPFAAEGKHFTEVRLLNREVDILLQVSLICIITLI
jgi:staphylococcal nuclease domain-containing protein 1